MVVPYKNDNSNKKTQVANMFNNIAHKYDFLNHILSVGIDIGWRKKAIALLAKKNPQTILDIATGTADFAIAANKLNPKKIVGVDIASAMIEIGKIKIIKKELTEKITLQLGDSEALEFTNECFDAITCSFGVRNFENLELGISEMYRVLKTDGQLMIMEFSKPQGFFIKPIFNIYFKYILPFVGKLISKDNAAYSYLPESVNSFPYGEKFSAILFKTGFKECKIIPLSFGIASIYYATK